MVEEAAWSCCVAASSFHFEVSSSILAQVFLSGFQFTERF